MKLQEGREEACGKHEYIKLIIFAFTYTVAFIEINNMFMK
jgi:hypothetical protein